MATIERGGRNKVGERPRRHVRRKPVKRTPTTSTTSSAKTPSSPSDPQAQTATSGRPTPPKKSPPEAKQGVERQAKVSGYLGTSAPPFEAPLWKRHIIERTADLVQLSKDLMDVTVLALDAEFSQPHLYTVRQPDEPVYRLALLQLALDADERHSYVIDTLRIDDLSALQAPLQNANILKLFQDINLDAKMLATRGLVASNTLDVEAVSRSIFGQREAGLQTMVLRAYGVLLDKSYQRANWGHRPLHAAMLAYAARDAEMTLALYRWLREYYAWAIELHHMSANEQPPAIAEWILPYLKGSRPRPAALAVAEAGIANNITAQEQSLRQALVTVPHPSQRARVMRLLADLELARLTPDLHPHLASPASEERQSAARAIGRLRDKAAIELLRPLLNDPVQEVRQAATLALDQLSGTRPVVPHPYPPRTQQQNAAARTTNGAASSTVKWSSEPEDASAPVAGGWQEALRARFGSLPTTPDDGNDESKK